MLLNPDAAQEFLRRITPGRRRKGEVLYAQGSVQRLEVTAPTAAYSCQVEDGGATYDVALRYEYEAGWNTYCTCGTREQCEHGFASMTALLAEYRAAAVQALSSGKSSAQSAATARKSKDSADTAQIGRMLNAALGRALRREEKTFLASVHGLYQQYLQQGVLYGYDLGMIGFSAPQSWAPLHLWPTPPRNEHEFWLYVANYVAEHGMDIPEFMKAVTDLEPIRNRLRDYHRHQEIARWTKDLQDFNRNTFRGEAETLPPTDLRVRVDEKGMSLEVRLPGRSEFKQVKQGQLREFTGFSGRQMPPLTVEGEMLAYLFQSIAGAPFIGFAEPGLGYRNDLVNRLFRTKSLESRIVNTAEIPLARPPEPLKWQLACPAKGERDYLLQLMLPDGSPPATILTVLEGRPTLYITCNAVYQGPPGYHRLQPARPNPVPAEVVEKAEGVAFVEKLGADLPPSLRERIKRVPFRVVITCRLQPPPSPGASETCVLQVLAESADGAESRIWTGYNWLEERVRPKVRKGDSLLIPDDALLNRIPDLLEPLNLRPHFGGVELTTRVTRKFPEIFSQWLHSLPPEVSVQLEGELASLTGPDVAGKIRLEVSEAEIDWFDMRVVLDVSDTELTGEEIRLLMNARGSYVRLKGKGWRRLKYDLTEEEDERLARLGLTARELSAEPQRLHALQLADNAARKFLPDEQVEQLQHRAAEIKTRVAPDMPPGVTAVLRPYQLDGFHFLAYLSTNRFGGILADDMGLGKTLQTLTWLLWLRSEPSDSRPPPSLVVCPKSVMDNWHAEAERFTAGLRVRTWPSSELPKFAQELETADVHVLNYNQLRILGESLCSVRWLAVILDEGQYIKNPGSQTAQVARSLHASHRLILSGTPIENRLLDLWSLMAFAMPGILGSRAQFNKLYDSKGDPFARQRLAARVRPFLLRRTKAQVAKDLPDRIEEDLFCEMEGEQQTLYRAELKQAQRMLLRVTTRDELAREQFHLLASLLRLRQICCHPRLIQPESKEIGAKTEALLEQLEPLMDEGHKVLVFSQFVEMLQLLKPLLQERQWPVFYLAGNTENRGDLVKDFQASEGAAVFLISLKAGGFGLNLTAASYVVLFDPWWNPAVENQAIDRTHRIGQENKVIAYRLLIKDSIEEKIRALQRQKKSLADNVLGEERFAQSLSIEDLQFLLAD